MRPANDGVQDRVNVQLQGILGNHAEGISKPVPDAEAPSLADYDAPIKARSAAQDREDAAHARPSGDDYLNDWPILREGEGGKLVSFSFKTNPLAQW